MELTIVFFWIVVAAFTAAIATSKNRSGLGWFVLGLLFSILAMIAVAAMPPRKEGPDALKRCPDCAEMVRLDARTCRFCGNKLSSATSVKEAEIFASTRRYQTSATLIAAVLAAAVVTFIAAGG